MVTRKQVEAVARLARLRLNDAEAERMTRELNGILDHVTDLGEVDVRGVDALDGVIEHAPPARADEPGTDGLARPPSTFAPGWADEFFTVPKLEALADPESGD